MSNVLVTGADGFLGKVVCARLLESGHTPIAGVRGEEGWFSLCAAVPGIKRVVVLGDLGTATAHEKLLGNAEAVIHLAARVHVMNQRTGSSIETYRKTNVEGTIAIAQAATNQGVQRIVFVSTVKVNGERTSSTPFREEDEPHPEGPYALSKCEAEDALRRIAARTGMEVVIVRPPLVYGPGVRANFLHLLTLVDHRVPLPMPNESNKRSLVGVANLADFLVKCVHQERAANQTYLVSDKECISTRELILRIAQALGRNVRFLPIPTVLLRLTGAVAGRRREIDRLLSSLVVNSDKARRMLGWTPPVSLEEGLTATVDWYRKSLSSVGDRRRR